MARPPDITFVQRQSPESALGQNLLIWHAIVHSLLIMVGTSLAGHPIGIFAMLAWGAFIASEVCFFTVWKRLAKCRLDRAFKASRDEVFLWGAAALTCHVICFPISFLTSYVAGCFLWSTLAAQLGLRVASPTMLEKHELGGARLSLGQLFAVISGVGIALGLIRTALMLTQQFDGGDSPAVWVALMLAVAMIVTAASFLSLVILTWTGSSWLGNLLALALGGTLPLLGFYFHIQQNAEDEQIFPLVISGAVLLTHAVAMWPFLASGWRMTFAVPLVESSQGIVFINPSKATASDPKRTA